MYSAGKAALEAERQKFKLTALEKAKRELQQLKTEIEETQLLSKNPEWTTRAVNIVQKAVQDYEAFKQELTNQLQAIEKAQKDELRIGVIDLLQKANLLDTAFDEIKQALGQILSYVTAKNENAEKESRVLFLLEQELG